MEGCYALIGRRKFSFGGESNSRLLGVGSSRLVRSCKFLFGAEGGWESCFVRKNMGKAIDCFGKISYICNV